MRKEPPLTAPKAEKPEQTRSAVQHLEDDVFASGQQDAARLVAPVPNDGSATSRPRKPGWPLTRIQIEVLIEKSALEAALPQGFDESVKAEMPALVAAQEDRQAVEASNKRQMGFAALSAAGVLGWLGYQGSGGGIGTAIGLGVLGLVGGYVLASRALKARVPVDDFEGRFPNAVTEQRILQAVENLNSEGKILARALQDGFIKQAWLDNMHTRRRIENDIASARQQLEYNSRREATERKEGKGISAATASNLASANALLSVATAELTGSQAWTYPDIAECRKRYAIDRSGTPRVRTQ